MAFSNVLKSLQELLMAFGELGPLFGIAIRS